MWYNHLQSSQNKARDPESVLVKGLEKLEGEYMLQAERANGRPIYKRPQNVDKPEIVLWSQEKSWFISRAIGREAYAFVNDSAKSPLQIQSVWKHWSFGLKTWQKIFELRLERKPRSLGFNKAKGSSLFRIPKQLGTLNNTSVKPIKSSSSSIKVLSPGSLEEVSSNSPSLEEEGGRNMLERILSSISGENTDINSPSIHKHLELEARAPRRPLVISSSESVISVHPEPLSRDTERLDPSDVKLSNVFDFLHKPIYPKTTTEEIDRKRNESLDTFFEEFNNLKVPSDIESQSFSDLDKRSVARFSNYKSQNSLFLESDFSLTTMSVGDPEADIQMYKHQLEELCAKMQELPMSLGDIDFDDIMEQFYLDREKLQQLKSALYPECERLKELSQTKNPVEEQKRLAEQARDLDGSMNELTSLYRGLKSELKSVEEEIEALMKRRSNLVEMMKKNNQNRQKVQEMLLECKKRRSTRQSVRIAQIEFAKASLDGITTNFKNAEVILGNLRERLTFLEKEHEVLWRSWDSYTLVSWICRLNEGKFAKFKGFWCESFEQDKVEGKDLPVLTMSKLKDLGINILEERYIIYEAIQDLMKKGTKTRRKSNPVEMIIESSAEEQERNRVIEPIDISEKLIEALDQGTPKVPRNFENTKSDEGHLWRALLSAWNLELYVKAFAENGYDDTSDWGELTDKELATLGMLTGHIKKFRRRFWSWKQSGKIVLSSPSASIPDGNTPFGR